jgi:deazaflavin-dependent oxidoreductase (nitroreductase family)
MDDTIASALREGGLVDITTTGRKSGEPRRIEIYFHHFDGDYYVTGRPGFRRDWLANLLANPEFTLHLKRGVSADLPAVASPIDDGDERTRILYRILTESWGRSDEEAQSSLDRWVDQAPLVRFRLA